jgi:hypothetical protein
MEFPETSAYTIQMPWNHTKEGIQHSGHGENFEIKDIDFLYKLSNSQLTKDTALCN